MKRVSRGAKGPLPPTRSARRLIYIPVVHSEADMGSMASPLKKEFAQKLGAQHWRRHVRTVNDMWGGIKRKLRALALDPRTVRVYQDGLPICGKEQEIVEDVARRGSKNYQLVRGLLARGAHLEGTEDAQLLVAEYSCLKQLLAIADLERRKVKLKEMAGTRARLLKQRDQFIAARIADTLKPGETGILFIGLTHSVHRYLPKDIAVSYLITRLPFQEVIKEFREPLP